MGKESLAKPASGMRSWKWILIAGYIVAVIVTAVLTYIVVRDLVIGWEITDLPGMVISTATASPQSGATIGEETPQAESPGVIPMGPTPLPWDGTSRVSILVMGLDYRDWESGEKYSRSDTMILFTIDPVSKTAGILSIPRDLWVTIPGFGYGKINMAYYLGDANKLPGGGQALARQTVEALLGVPVQYSAVIDFSAFVWFVDLVGGVKVDIPEKIKVDLIGDGYKTIKTLKPGVQRLPGEWALAYARARNTKGGDFDRAARQQQVIMALRDRILRFDMVPMLLAKAPEIYAVFNASANTNMDLETAIRLGWLAKDIPQENIKQGVIGKDQVTFGKSPDGLDILKPRSEEIRRLRDEIFSAGAAYSPITGMSAEELMKAENARLSVQNGSMADGMAARTADYLKSLGMNIVDISNADQVYNATRVIDYTGNPYTLKYLIELMNISPYNIFSKFDPSSPFDVRVIVGNDWANNNPMP